MTSESSMVDPTKGLRHSMSRWIRILEEFSCVIDLDRCGFEAVGRGSGRLADTCPREMGMAGGRLAM